MLHNVPLSESVGCQMAGRYRRLMMAPVCPDKTIGMSQAKKVGVK